MTARKPRKRKSFDVEAYCRALSVDWWGQRNGGPYYQTLTVYIERAYRLGVKHGRAARGNGRKRNG